MGWFKAHKAIIAWLSLLGSLAGVAFSAVDVHDTMKKKRKT